MVHQEGQVSKYRNAPTAGFASRKEARRAWELQMLERAGKISDLQFQVPFEIVPACQRERAAHYVADFVYQRDGVQVVEDSKGFKTAEYRLKRKLMLHVHGIKILET
jgi:hypothetical protein